MPDPTPTLTPPPDFERRLRAQLGDLVARAPDSPAHRAALDARVAENWEQLGRRRRFIAGAAAATAAAGLGLTWSLIRRDDESSTQAVDVGPTPPASGRTTGGWRQIDAASLSPRRNPAVVWADGRLIVWGGTSVPGPDYILPPDGTSWSPDSGRWSKIRSAPSGAIGGGFAVWSGREILVGVTEADSGAPWNDGVSDAEVRYGIAAYDPTADSWRYVAPIRPDTDARLGSSRQAVLVGGQLLVAVHTALPGAAGHANDIVLVDVATGDQRPVDPGPFTASPYPDASGSVSLTALDGLVIATTNWDPQPWVLDLEEGSWRRASAPAIDSLHLLPAVAAGNRAAYIASDTLQRLMLDPRAAGAGEWSDVAPNPYLPASWNYEPVWSGQELFVPGAAYDPANDSWRAVEPPPRGVDRQRSLQARWADGGLLLFGGEEYSCPDATPCDRTPGPDTLDGWLLADP